jgi:hypothetical protein
VPLYSTIRRKDDDDDDDDDGDDKLICLNGRKKEDMIQERGEGGMRESQKILCVVVTHRYIAAGGVDVSGVRSWITIICTLGIKNT